jgi:hypothetical protein
MARVTKVEHAQKDYPEYEIKKGDTYYWWKFRFGGKHVSKTYPNRSQLTQSSFLGSLYDLEDNWSLDREDPQGSIEDLKSQVEDLKSQCEESLENMPDNLRENSESGNLLQERIDQCDEWIGNLEGIDADINEEDFEIPEEDQQRIDALPEKEREAALEEVKEQMRNDRLDEIEQEVQDANPGLS